MSNKSNTEHLHEAGVIDKSDISEEHQKAIDTLSKEEIENLKAIDGNMKKSHGVGVML
jgi:hypothetical protein